MPRKRKSQLSAEVRKQERFQELEWLRAAGASRVRLGGWRRGCTPRTPGFVINLIHPDFSDEATRVSPKQ